MDELDYCIKSLNEATTSSEVLTESVDIEKIGKTVLNKLAKSSVLKGGVHYNEIPQGILDNVSKVRITDVYRVITYPNIHNDNKYGIRASLLFDYVIDQVCKAATEEVPANSSEINGSALAYLLKALTGSSPKDKLTVVEFKQAYKTRVFGSTDKVQVVPRPKELVLLARKIPFIINYIDSRLIYRNIRSMNQYIDTTKTELNRLLKSHPDISKYVDSYIGTIDDAITNSIKVYRVIRDTFIELNNEYYRIFNQILSIDNRIFVGDKTNLDKSINECISTINESSDGVTDNFDIAKSVLENNLTKLSTSMTNDLHDVYDTLANYSVCNGTMDTISIPEPGFYETLYDSLKDFKSIESVFCNYDASEELLHTLICEYARLTNSSFGCNATFMNPDEAISTITKFANILTKLSEIVNGILTYVRNGNAEDIYTSKNNVRFRLIMYMTFVCMYLHRGIYYCISKRYLRQSET